MEVNNESRKNKKLMFVMSLLEIGRWRVLDWYELLWLFIYGDVEDYRIFYVMWGGLFML